MRAAEEHGPTREFIVEEHDVFDELPIPTGGDAAAVLGAAADAIRNGHHAALATVAARRGSTPATAGQKLLLSESGTCVGTVGGGALERRILNALVQRLRSPGLRDAETVTLKLGQSLGMCCGGTVEVILESLIPLVPVVLVGAGHIGVALAPLLAQCGFTVTLADERPEFHDRATALFRQDHERIRCVDAGVKEAATHVPRRAALIAMTHDHQLDQQVLEWALRENFAFVGGVGSRAKAARLRTRLLQKGFAAEQLERIRMPVGADIGARSPNEIAVAVVAELIAWRAATSETD